MTISFGILARSVNSGDAGDSISGAVSNAVLAERCGFDFLGFVDSQSVYRELYVTMAACAIATSRVKLGPIVSNPVTRHPSVSASAIASINDLAPGRTEFGIGSGDSAVLNLGARPARLADLREYVLTVKDLLTEGAAHFAGNNLKMSWSASDKIPLYIAASGPKTLELAGEIADGVVLNTGLQADLIQEALAHIAVGAQRAGRDPAELDVRLTVRVNVCDDRAAGIQEIAMELASNANHVFRFTTEGKQVPTEFLEAIERVQAGYVPSEHGHNTGANAAVISREPALLEYLADRFAVVGTPDQCAEQLVDITKAGITSIVFTGFVANRSALIEALGTEVIPRVREAIAVR